METTSHNFSSVNTHPIFPGVFHLELFDVSGVGNKERRPVSVEEATSRLTGQVDIDFWMTKRWRVNRGIELVAGKKIHDFNHYSRSSVVAGSCC
jgi:hypothetical protein